ncbi:MAG TPA: chemotaxis response regulator protein-glutamate methylesterase [Chloroflexota bacterium]|nr:chemotaxis response regulator protein-glutamate methylesterase [Chloroflexota bacterium]
MEPASQRIRVLIAEDSAFMRMMIGKVLREDPAFEVIGYAADGAEAVEKVAQLKPEAVTMDVEMPRMNGIEAVDRIMQRTPTPIVMLSSMTHRGAAVTIEALAKGAVDFVPKPGSGAGGDLGAVAVELKDKLRRAASLNRFRLAAARVPPPRPVSAALRGNEPPTQHSALSTQHSTRSRSRRVVAIGTSTGGPAALTQLMAQLPADLTAGVLVVQHMPAGFTKALAERLDGLSPLCIREAAEGDQVEDGLVLVAPGDFHMLVQPSGRVALTKDPPVHSVRPAADVLMSSVARVYGRCSLGVVLTGMGHDGADGATDIKKAGGQVMVQNEATSVVYGMAASVVKAGSADAILPLAQIAESIVRSLPG